MCNNIRSGAFYISSNRTSQSSGAPVDWLSHKSSKVRGGSTPPLTYAKTANNIRGGYPPCQTAHMPNSKQGAPPSWGQQPEWLAWWKSSFGRMKRVWGSELWGWLPMGLTSYELRVKDPAPPSPALHLCQRTRAAFEICNSNIHICQSSKNILSHSFKAARLWGWLPYPWVHKVHFCFFGIYKRVIRKNVIS